MYEVLVSNYFAKQIKRLAKKNQNLREALKVTLFNFNKDQAISIAIYAKSEKENLSLNEMSKHLEKVKSEFVTLLR